ALGLHPRLRRPGRRAGRPQQGRAGRRPAGHRDRWPGRAGRARDSGGGRNRPAPDAAGLATDLRPERRGGSGRAAMTAFAPVLRGRRILLGVSGSIAAFKAVALASKLTQAGALVDVALTRGATELVTPLSFEAVT